jgi:multidrug efflux pump subunit AcrA (membrane-fusion protein)
VGLFVEAAIEGRMLEDVRILPRSALRDGSRVYLVSPENTLQRRTVEVLRATRENIVVAGTGLPMGTRVIVSPLEIATEGMRVKDISDRSR